MGVDYDSFVMAYQPCFAEEGQMYSGARRLRYAPEIRKVLCCENALMKLADPVTWQPSRTSFSVGGILLDAEYIPDRNMFLTSSSDLMLNLFEFDNPLRPVTTRVDYSQVQWKGGTDGGRARLSLRTQIFWC